MSTRDGKLTPIEEATINPFADLLVQWRAEAVKCESVIGTEFAMARSNALRTCANELERALASVRAIIRT